jgi:hypothetical protein
MNKYWKIFLQAISYIITALVGGGAASLML